MKFIESNTWKWECCIILLSSRGCGVQNNMCGTLSRSKPGVSKPPKNDHLGYRFLPSYQYQKKGHCFFKEIYTIVIHQVGIK